MAERIIDGFEIDYNNVVRKLDQTVFAMFFLDLQYYSPLVVYEFLMFWESHLHKIHTGQGFAELIAEWKNHQSRRKVDNKVENQMV